MKADHSKATPRPWKQDANEIFGGEGTHDALIVLKLACGHISQAPVFSYLDMEQRKYTDTVTANAALIVQAVNHFDALNEIAELSNFLCGLSNQMEDADSGDLNALALKREEIIEQISAALAKLPAVRKANP